MNRFYAITMATVLSLGFLSCKLLLPDDTGERPEHLTDKTWYWLETHDPYGGGTWYRPSANSSQHTFYFGRDGHYVEDRPRGCCRWTGTWRLTEDGESLTLRPESGQPHTYALRHLSPDTLRLGTMGRHGILTITFILTDVTGT